MGDKRGAPYSVLPRVHNDGQQDRLDRPRRYAHVCAIGGNRPDQPAGGNLGDRRAANRGRRRIECGQDSTPRNPQPTAGARDRRTCAPRRSLARSMINQWAAEPPLLSPRNEADREGVGDVDEEGRDQRRDYPPEWRFGQYRWGDGQESRLADATEGGCKKVRSHAARRTKGLSVRSRRRRETASSSVN